MSWILIALLAAACAGAANITNKYVFARLSQQPMVQTISGGVVGVIISTIVTVIHGYASMSWPHALIAVLAGFCFGLSLMATLYAVRLGDVSQVGPLRLLTPVFVAVLAAVFLEETLSLHVYAGILLILIGASLIEKPKALKVRLNSVAGFMVASGLMLAVMQVLTKYLLRFHDPYTVLLYVRFGLLLFIIPLLVKYFRMMTDAIKPRPLYNLGVLIVPGFLGTSSMFLLMFAADKGPVTVVSALASTTPFFILLYVSWLSHRLPDVYAERTKNVNFAQRAVFIAIMFVGVVLTL
jgi:drug/metabolite transporter (DMT)-like permease